MPHSSASKTEHRKNFIFKRDPHFTNIISRDKNTSSKWSLNIQVNFEPTEVFINFRSENPTKRGTNCMQ
ncbi:hypothetical protein E1A91_D11G306000v1 [Gossypium mustelinum]|uniref:Uncharacterized protein n=1 Tax=Gossypium mustelinum TaxID=34275 RepID=A0A5D2SY44_GOSMU|nr:hypothetical protein E1A91_D11G306000v1 [Gossypium mustelinum]